MKCNKCNSNLLSIYYRDNLINKRNWVKISYYYCKNCKKVKKW